MQDNLKKTYRERILTLLRNQEEKERLDKSLIVLNKLFNLREIKNSLIIMFYSSFDGEVETLEMIKKAVQLEKKVVLPKIIKDNSTIIPKLVESLEMDLENGAYGIKEPKEQLKTVDVKDIDAVVVPGVVYDKTCYRLGRGGGYYDRFLKTLPKDTPTIGLAFDFQIIEEVPRNNYDFPVSCVVTN